MFGLGLPEMGIVLAIAVLFLGPSKLPQLGKSIGGAISNFRSSVAGKGEAELNDNKELK
ncbi:MAG: twin-arginine translocase TatA/TatE family subunit [Nitrospirae bacterium]|nr:twin-arginine translocase TatA/TatE family subunit [Nitrospirota bacterium]